MKPETKLKKNWPQVSVKDLTQLYKIHLLFSSIMKSNVLRVVFCIDASFIWTRAFLFLWSALALMGMLSQILMRTDWSILCGNSSMFVITFLQSVHPHLSEKTHHSDFYISTSASAWYTHTFSATDLVLLSNSKSHIDIHFQVKTLQK